MPTEAAARSLQILRDGSLFQWYVIPLFALIAYVYAAEMEKKNWNVVFAGLAFWGMDWFNEIWNGLVLHFTNYAPVWAAPGQTAYLILAGLNIEICFMFAIAGVVFSKMLPGDKRTRILGLPNRWFVAITGAAFCVFVEVVFLNGCGALTWDYSWWNYNTPWLIFLFGYLHFFAVAFWVHDMKHIASKAITVGSIFTFDIACLVLFAGILKWI